MQTPLEPRKEDLYGAGPLLGFLLLRVNQLPLALDYRQCGVRYQVHVGMSGDSRSVDVLLRVEVLAS
jgi:hypothetical protein